jgi:hypothetical protein
LPSTDDAHGPSLFATLPDIPFSDFSSSTSFSNPTTATASPSSSTTSHSAAALTPASYLAEQAARSAPTGFRNTSTPRIALDAPVQVRNSLLPSLTSRKRLNAAGERKLAAKRRKEQHATSAETSASPSGGESAPAAAIEDGYEVQQEALTATERKRLQNTLSARRCRARKQAKVQELEVENAALRERVEELEAMLRLVGGNA